MTDTRLASLAESWYRRQWNRYPTLGSLAGLSEYDALLEAPDLDLIASEMDDARDTLKELEAIPTPDAGTSAGDALDWRAFQAQLSLRLVYKDVQSHRKNPSAPVDDLITSVFYLLMRRDVAETSTAEAIVARLEAAPAYLAALKSRLTDPVGPWIDVAVEVALGGVPFVDDLAKGVAGKHPALRSKLKTAADGAAAALKAYVSWLKDLKPEALNPDPAIGAANLTRIVRHNHGLTESLDEIATFGIGQIAELKARQRALAAKIDPALKPGEIIKRAGRRYAESNPDVMADYRKLTFAIRDRLVAEGVLDLPPGETCDVISSPDFLRPVLPTAAYSAPGPLDRHQRGIFYVSDPSKDLPREDYLANVAMHFPLEPTCAHEAYPGHHLQLCWANRAPSLIRKLADHIIFMEGWTLYCEQLLVELGWYTDPVFELAYLNDQLWRACRVVIDAGVQSGAMTIVEAVSMLQAEVGFTPERAKAELNWYTQSPGTPMSYLIGKGKTLELRELYREKHPGSSLREFHGWLLSHGSIPQVWLKEMV